MTLSISRAPAPVDSLPDGMRSSRMRIGVPTETRPGESGAGIIPAGVRALTAHGHEVFVQEGAGLGAGISDEAYETAGATVLPGADEVWARADMVFKVKEPLPPEYP